MPVTAKDLLHRLAQQTRQYERTRLCHEAAVHDFWLTDPNERNLIGKKISGKCPGILGLMRLVLRCVGVPEGAIFNLGFKAQMAVSPKPRSRAKNAAT